MMKIGLSGAGGSGKSTVAEAVFERLHNNGFSVGLINEVARWVFREFSEEHGFKNLTEIRRSDKYINFQKRILDEQIKLERDFEQMFDIVICDRTIYDIYMYAFLYSDSESFESFLKYYNYRKQNFKEYDKIFLFEYLKGVNVDDGFRTPDINYRSGQEVILKNILRDYIYIPQKPIEVRVDEVIKHIIQ